MLGRYLNVRHAFSLVAERSGTYRFEGKHLIRLVVVFGCLGEYWVGCERRQEEYSWCTEGVSVHFECDSACV